MLRILLKANEREHQKICSILKIVSVEGVLVIHGLTSETSLKCDDVISLWMVPSKILYSYLIPT